ncbi:CDP-diacylglycerol--glycerol-3-phosphate 3-phosphatidyltransferase [Rhodovulum adriaticum]|uniref:CDP-diacylglycerol--glycerol-3-phosphate 3-phosphatidyltransferase n=1 Tax=Rhodovulum adriaticum TaxID=35804 RepID=A0A4R2NJF9_RHOAD|nr:CDP-diacylglycerol--glycerol-3-phosphate 3-phosphatidyltransferase [Rhodovulum adriaticum]MBK1636628.1 CDP-diacylglycerol--glycerol-3-phosphate 3-phosphatidyltransferase [Rhodovulum adriaticum]TCP21365.1 CDP-diacylglycerol--glycerol-3-phosphate 3-phosphatidyltransferase [Rhodovulum adriaticum]
MRWTIPNILSVARLILALLFPLIYVIWDGTTAHAVALAVFVGASATDWVDGYIARKFNQTSRFGAMVDPIADKAMVLIALVAVVAQIGFNPVLALSAGVIVFREVFVSGLREFLGAEAGKLKVTKLAKWKTTVQMVALTVLLAQGLVASATVAMLGSGLLAVAAVLTLITGADYFIKAWPYLREEKAT